MAQEQFFFFVDFFDSYDGFRRRGGIVSSLTLASNNHKVYFLLSYYRYHLDPLAAVSSKTFFRNNCKRFVHVLNCSGGKFE